MARPHVQLVGVDWFAWRLTDDEFVSLGHHALPLFRNYELLLSLSQHAYEGGRSFTLGHALTVLESKFGPSSQLFDSYRGSFSFPLLLTLERDSRTTLLFRCHDHRGMLHFPLYCITLGDPCEDPSRYQPPEPDDFSQIELDAIILGLYDLMRREADQLDTELVTPFFRTVQSDILLYGHDGVAFFERTYDRWDEYEVARRDLETRIGPRELHSSSERVRRIIARVTETHPIVPPR